MIRGFVLIIAVLGMVSAVWAQAVPPAVECPSFAWDANTETDLAKYLFHVDIEEGASSSWHLPPDQLEVREWCDAFGLSGAGSGTVFVTAVDTSGNESGPSEKIAFSWVLPDRTPPEPVIGFCETMDDPNGGAVRVCVTVGPLDPDAP